MDQSEALRIIREHAQEPAIARFALGWLCSRCSELELLDLVHALGALAERREALERELMVSHLEQPPLRP